MSNNISAMCSQTFRRIRQLPVAFAVIPHPLSTISLWIFIKNNFKHFPGRDDQTIQLHSHNVANFLKNSNRLERHKKNPSITIKMQSQSHIHRLAIKTKQNSQKYSNHQNQELPINLTRYQLAETKKEITDSKKLICIQFECFPYSPHRGRRRWEKTAFRFQSEIVSLWRQISISRQIIPILHSLKVTWLDFVNFTFRFQSNFEIFRKYSHLNWRSK